LSIQSKQPFYIPASEQNYSEKEVPEKGTFSEWCFKNNGHYVETWLLFSPPIKFSGYAPVRYTP